MTAEPAPDPIAPDLIRPDLIVQALARPGAPSSDYDLNPGAALPDGARRPRGAAVLIALIHSPGGVQVILTQRASHLTHHPGQIALPGGKIDAGDSGPVAAALREAREEIGLAPGQVEVLGEMPAHLTVTGYSVTPVVGWIRGAFVPVPEAGEVAEVFAVPFAHLADAGRYRVERRLWRGEWRRYHVVPWGPYYIWGATARMLLALASRLEP